VPDLIGEDWFLLPLPRLNRALKSPDAVDLEAHCERQRHVMRHNTPGIRRELLRVSLSGKNLVGSRLDGLWNYDFMSD